MDKPTSKVIRLSAGAVAYVAAAREAIRRYDGGMVPHVSFGPDEDSDPVLTLQPVDDAPDSAVIIHACALALRWLDPETRAAALKAEAARAEYIEGLDTWKGDAA